MYLQDTKQLKIKSIPHREMSLGDMHVLCKIPSAYRYNQVVFIRVVKGSYDHGYRVKKNQPARESGYIATACRA